MILVIYQKEAFESYLTALREDLVAAPIEKSLFIGMFRVEVAGLLILS